MVYNNNISKECFITETFFKSETKRVILCH